MTELKIILCYAAFYYICFQVLCAIFDQMVLKERTKRRHLQRQANTKNYLRIIKTTNDHGTPIEKANSGSNN